MPADEEIVTFRLAPRDRVAIQRLVEAGEFRNRSDFLRYAVKTSLDHFDASRTAKVRSDLEIEGVDLPQAGAKPTRAHPRGRRGVNL
ncbi:MAG TPA: ribbon-helix-helix domain-containing protein [Candidatus Thermoplasmatota archaeon]|nr:ribbon-helix-helix domain-containing protein [Candidatus Thermoplasmatota archaeon]